MSWCFVLFLACPKAWALGAAQPALPDPGTAQLSLAGGLSRGSDELYPLGRLEGAIGLHQRVAVRLPVSLELALLRPSRDSALVVSGGLSDVWISPLGKPYTAWAAAVAGRVRLGAEAAVHLGIGVNGALGESRLRRSVWFEGGAAFVLDVGPYATVALGFAYERLVTGPGTTHVAARLGWVDDAHIQLLCAPLESQWESPLLTVHLPGGLELIAVVTVDVEARTRQTTTRYLLGLGGIIPDIFTKGNSRR
ncbi:MAG: hypothetical protein MUC50_23185 [Myxococcota bacterium]|nr:hypothetical protein [Myxococcota bacterium]